jgi:hypothetical protein
MSSSISLKSDVVLIIQMGSSTKAKGKSSIIDSSIPAVLALAIVIGIVIAVASPFIGARLGIYHLHLI